MFRPLDLITTDRRDKGKGGVVHFVQTFQFGKSDCTHVGVLVNCDVLPTLIHDDGWYSIESNLYKNESGQLIDGFHLRPINTIQNYKIFKLKNNPWITGTSYEKIFIQQELQRIVNQYSNKKYQKNILNLAFSVFTWIRPFKSRYGNKNNVFCSQVVFIIYSRLMILKTLPRQGFEVSPQHLIRDLDLFE